MSPSQGSPVRHLFLVLGDQLDPGSPVFNRLDPKQDAVWMAELEEESTHVTSHKARIALFLSAIRHFRVRLEEKGLRVHYRRLDGRGNRGSFASELEWSVRKLQPEKMLAVEPGEYRVRESLTKTGRDLAIPLEFLPDCHFLCSRDDFEEHASGRKQLRMEFFYRAMRKRTGVLMKDGEPVGGDWNYDTENRGSFGKEGPGRVPEPFRVEPDEITKDVIKLVGERFRNHPGSLRRFAWPVTPEDAERALEDFVSNRLPAFGPRQDAMWTGQPFLYHSLLSSSFNLKLLNPREAIDRVEKACRGKKAAIASAEGFIRQILGWREYVRGIYWSHMPDYGEMNELGADANLPDLYWTAETDMNCLRNAIRQTLEYGYAHHIQRLMVTGLFALLLGVDPKQVHRWYLGIYVDAVEWVELPNTLGMSQFADGGIMASKPYAASGNYIRKMSNYCDGCRYNPSESTGEDACPFTTLYWDFLMRHRKKLGGNPRMGLQLKNLERLSSANRREIRDLAGALRERIA